jgi:ribonuclease P protein component
VSSAQLSFPPAARLRRTADYRRTYKEGSKFVGPLFAAFYRPNEPGEPARVGYTTPRSMGKAVVRNRIKRRMREAVRLRLAGLTPGWDVVFNPRRAVLDASFDRLMGEIDRLFHILRSIA